MVTMNKIIDLTYSIEEGMLTFDAPWHPQVSIEQLGRIEVEGRESRKIIFGTHAGTHVDAPLHFIKEGKGIDEIPLEKLIGPVTIIDFSNLPENQSITKEMLSSVNITKRMIFKFGWGKYWGDKIFYKNYPYFSVDGAEYLLSKNVELIGYDSPSPDDSRTKLGSEQDSKIHKILLGNDVILVEYLANLDQVLDYDGWNISVMPLKIKNADGSSARVILYK